MSQQGNSGPIEEPPPPKVDPMMLPVNPPVDPEKISADIKSLGDDATYCDEKRFSVFIASAEQIPSLLEEICRLREIAFREVGEGTGEATDRDEFDDHYLHAILWDKEEDRIAGGYRIGLTDEILGRFGPAGLYCSSLFQFEPEFLDFLNPGFELGRSFVALDYQRMMQPLALLWRGIGRLMVEKKRYRYLFGPVSISQNYTPISKHLLVEFMKKERSHPRLSNLVKPRNAFQSLTDLESRQISESLTTIQEVSARIAQSEPDGKGIPILLKHYLKLNATVLNFNVDPSFSNALDALLLVDMAQIPGVLLKKYCGEAGAQSLLKKYSS